MNNKKEKVVIHLSFNARRILLEKAKERRMTTSDIVEQLILQNLLTTGEKIQELNKGNYGQYFR